MTAKGKYKEFEDARTFVHTLRLQGKNDWEEYCRLGKRPKDIPSNPNRHYKDKGWKGWRDFLCLPPLVPKIIKVVVARPEPRDFEAARDYVQGLRFTSVEAYRAWASSGDRPPDIPSNPNDAYREKGWITWGDWLGTGRIKRGKQIYLSFIKAREVVQRLGLKSVADWQKWSSSGERPPDIPSAPDRQYKNQGWISWPDWMGTENRAPQDIYRDIPFEKARAEARKLGIVSLQQWRQAVKSANWPVGVPKSPHFVYKNKGWTDWPDWLGQPRKQRPKGQGQSHRRKIGSSPRPEKLLYDEARSYIHEQGVTCFQEWNQWKDDGKRPLFIPANPDTVYKGKGWVDWPHWFGKESVPTVSYEEAQQFAQTLSLSSAKDWREWVSSGNRPPGIPASPDDVYKNKGWTNWGDFLGTGNVCSSDLAKDYWMFEEARSYVRAQHILTHVEWQHWSKTKRPRFIPAGPNIQYAKQWHGWSDWLGTNLTWNRATVLSFLRGLRSHLPALSHMVLMDILRNQGVMQASKAENNSNAPLLRDIVRLARRNNLTGLSDRIGQILGDSGAGVDDGKVDGKSDGGEDGVVDPDVAITGTVIPPHGGSGVNARERGNLQTLAPHKRLDATDFAARQYPGKDVESIEFIINDQVAGLWRDFLYDEAAFDLNGLIAHLAGEYGAQVRERFLEQLHGARNLPIPEGYAYPKPPFMMQRLVAYRLLTEKRLGNWSGTGAGKTLAAILASRACDARLTVIIGVNNTIKLNKDGKEQGWAKEIHRAFPDSDVKIKERGELDVDPQKHTFLLLNFESFQQRDSVAMVRHLIENHQVDMIVLDEIQNAKLTAGLSKQRRLEAGVSRRKTLLALLCGATEKNPELRVLGMSATPVINDLAEAKSLLEMIQGVEFPDLETTLSMTNIAAMYKALVLFGVRAIPHYSQDLKERTISIPASHLYEDVRRVKWGDILGTEQALIDAKIPTIVAQTVPGTLVYTHYIQGIVGPLREALEEAGFRVGVYTGQDDSGMDQFLKREVDVLIGSDTLMEGVDGLQHVSNRLVIATLPWTGADYEQLVGRLHREGSPFAHVDVIIPQVIIGDEGNDWSWDQQRMDRITYKQEISDAVLDGIMPDGRLESRTSLLARSREALEAWISRLEERSLAPNIERPLIRVPLPQEEQKPALRRFGDFSRLNARWGGADSAVTHARLTANPTEWELYHTLYREARKDWPEVPYERIAQEIAARPDWVVGDFGCGVAGLARILDTHQVHNFDHVAIDDSVTACDMSHTPLPDQSLDVAVFSLSLMGTNWREYLAEAHRVLKPRGSLFIAETSSHRAGEKRTELMDALREAGFRAFAPTERGAFLYVEALRM